MIQRTKQLILQIVGGFFIVIGLLGLFLPILQGVLFLLIGVCLLGWSSPRVQRYIERMQEWHPRTGRQFQKIDRKLRRLLRM